MDIDFLELQNVTIKLPNSKKFIFNNLNLSFNNNSSIIGLLGSNGSGKTVLAKVIMGLIKIKSGQINLFGKDIANVRTTKRLDLVSLSFQMINMSFLKQTIHDELTYNQYLNIKRKKTVNTPIEKLISSQNFLTGKENQHPLTLSGGEKRKLSFYLLKMNDPEFYILDEPTVGLDQYGIQELIKEIKQLQRLKKKILLITHNLAFLMALTDEVIIIEKDEQSQISSLNYQGSLTAYLLSNTDQATSFLSIPLEFGLYRNQLLSKEINEQIDYKTFLEMNNNQVLKNKVK